MSSSSNGSKVFFFDNPHRYDSNENLSATTNWPGSVVYLVCFLSFVYVYMLAVNKPTRIEQKCIKLRSCSY